MNTFIVIYTTFKDNQEADKIVDLLIDKKYIACANFLSLEARYFWEGKLTKVDEVGALLKTKKENWEGIKNEIEKVHSYKIPCIIKFEVESNKSYADWIKEEVEFVTKNLSSGDRVNKNFSDSHRSFKLSQQAVILNNKNEVLVLLASDPNKIDHWLLPGGRVDKDEVDLENALERELQEETGLILLKQGIAMGTDISMGGSTFAVAYLCEVKDLENIKLSEEHSEYRWVNSSELEKHLFYKKIGREIYNHFNPRNLVNPGSGN